MCIFDMGVDLHSAEKKLLLETVRDLASRKKTRRLLTLVLKLRREPLQWLFGVVGLANEQDGFDDRKHVHEIATMLPLEVHSAIMCRLWPKRYGERWPPKMKLTATKSGEMIDAMKGRHDDDRGLRHPGDEVELADRVLSLFFNRDRRKKTDGPREDAAKRVRGPDRNGAARVRAWRARMRGREPQALAEIWPETSNPEMLRITRMRLESMGAGDPCAVARVRAVCRSK